MVDLEVSSCNWKGKKNYMYTKTWKNALGLTWVPIRIKYLWTYLIGSYSWPDCDIIALILSSSEALASARLAVCLTGNYLTHTLETHLRPHSQRQHHSSCKEQYLILHKKLLTSTAYKRHWVLFRSLHDVWVSTGLKQSLSGDTQTLDPVCTLH